jgi:hypothetical protein
VDDRTWWLASGALGVGAAAMVLDAVVPAFNISPGFWAFLSAMLGFLGARAAIRMRNGDHQGGGK